MTNTLVPIKKNINYRIDYNYLQPRSNFNSLIVSTANQVSKVEEPLLMTLLDGVSTVDTDYEDDELSVAPQRAADLPLASDYGDMGYMSALPICGVLNSQLRYPARC